MEDLRIGRAIRAIRHQLGWRQCDLAHRATLSQSMVSLVERGRVEGLSIRALRRVCAALGADVVLIVRWRAGDLDRLLDERHARLGGEFAGWLERNEWSVVPEVTFSVYGERGSIDLLAWHATTRTLLVIELKSELTSIEEMLRRLDAKVRLAPGIAAARFGWKAVTVARLVVFPSDRSTRRRVGSHATLLRHAFPATSTQVRKWLPRPSGAIAGLLFLTVSDQIRTSRGSVGRKRVDRPRRAFTRA